METDILERAFDGLPTHKIIDQTLNFLESDTFKEALTKEGVEDSVINYIIDVLMGKIVHDRDFIDDIVAPSITEDRLNIVDKIFTEQETFNFFAEKIPEHAVIYSFISSVFEATRLLRLKLNYLGDYEDNGEEEEL